VVGRELVAQALVDNEASSPHSQVGSTEESRGVRERERKGSRGAE